MQKSLLKAIPIQQSNKVIANYSEANNVEAIITCEMKTVKSTKTLILNIFFSKELSEGIFTPKLRVFCTKSDYITQVINSAKPRWLTGCLDNIMAQHIGSTFLGGRYLRWDDYSLIYGKDSINVLSEFLGKKKDLINKFMNYQQGIIAARYKKKAKREADRIKKIMSTVPALPKDWRRWLITTGIWDTNCIFYLYKKTTKPLIGRCTACNNIVSLDNPKPKHNQKGVCPHCKAEVTFKAFGKQYEVPFTKDAYLIQTAKDNSGIWMRNFLIKGNHYRNNPSEIYYCYEKARLFFDNNGNCTIYEYGVYSDYVTRWGKNRNRVPSYEGALYEKNIKDVIKDTQYQYSALYEFATHKRGYSFYPYQLFYRYPKHKYLEYLIKLGLNNLTEEVLNYSFTSRVNEKGKTVEAVLKCDKSLINQIIEIDADSSEIAFLEAARKKGIRFSNTNEYFDYRQRYGLNEGLLSVLKYTTLHKINRYFDSLPKNKLLGCRYGYQYNYYDKEAKYRNLAHDYCDYFTWCKELRYNLKDEFILFPRDFKAAHDETSKIHQQHKDEIEKRKLAKMEKKYTDKILPDLVTKFDYKSEQFMVIIPRCKNDLVMEGKKLHHCVGGYSESVLNGTKIILFIRNTKEPGKPFYTCEINKNSLTLVQCRGLDNCSMTEPVKNFVNKMILEAVKFESSKDTQRKTECA